MQYCVLLLLTCPWAALQAGGCPDLNPVDDGGTTPNLIISAIDPGEWIEVYNPGDTPYDFDTSEGDLCEPFTYTTFPDLSPGTVLEPGSYARLPWPGNFNQSDEAGGQIIIYNIASLHQQENIADFVCWGDGGGGRKSEAEAVGKWSGDCAAAISAGMTIRRLASTDGTTAASYDTNAPPENCETVAPLFFFDGFEDIK